MQQYIVNHLIESICSVLNFCKHLDFSWVIWKKQFYLRCISGFDASHNLFFSVSTLFFFQFYKPHHYHI